MTDQRKSLSRRLKLNKLWNKETNAKNPAASTSLVEDPSPLSDPLSQDFFSISFDGTGPNLNENYEDTFLRRQSSVSTESSINSSQRRISVASNIKTRHRASSSFSSAKSDGIPSLSINLSDSPESNNEPLSPISSNEEADMKTETSADAIAQAILEKVKNPDSLHSSQKWIL